MTTATDTRTLWFLDALMTIKVSTQDGDGGLSLIEAVAPASSMPPLHVHDEDEAFYLLEGEATFYVGDAEFDVHAGEAVLGPRGVPHTYRVGPDGARWVVATSPGRFEGFVRAVSRPAETATLPPAAQPTQEQVAAVAAAARQHGIELLGPPGTLPTQLARPTGGAAAPAASLVS